MTADPHMDGCTVGFDRPRLHHSREGISPIYVGMLAHLVYSRFALRYVCERVILVSFVASSVCRRSGLHQVERNLDVAPCSVGIGTCLAVRRVHNDLGDFAFQTRHADVKPCSEEVNVARMA
jgi:hypothetical protein